MHYLIAIMFEFIHYANVIIRKMKTWTAATSLNLSLGTYLCITFNTEQCFSMSLEKLSEINRVLKKKKR